MHYNKCIYCNQEKKENEFSLEHIFPDALGGTYANELFKTRQVCQKCNSLAGLYIDSLFVKNFFLTKLFFSNYIGYYDFLNKPYIPFTYIGFYEDITHPQYKFCEVWQWYDKSVVYHFHNNSENDFKMIPGGDPRKRKNSHAGEVYLVGLVTNQFWIDLLGISFFKQFKKSRKIFVNYIVSNENINLTEIQLKIKDDLFLIHEKGKSPKYTVPMKIDFDIRFQAKLSLALGFSLFGKKFNESNEAISLRDIFWNKDYQKLKKIQPQMSSFFKKKDNFSKEVMKYLNFIGCHGLFFMVIENSLIFYGNLFGEGIYPISTIITNELDKYEHPFKEKYSRGWGYILIPQREVCIGEFDIGALIAFNTGDKSFLSKLEELEKKYISRENLPEFER